jgi:hypothetical protein
MLILLLLLLLLSLQLLLLQCQLPLFPHLPERQGDARLPLLLLLVLLLLLLLLLGGLLRVHRSGLLWVVGVRPRMVARQAHDPQQLPLLVLLMSGGLGQQACRSWGRRPESGLQGWGTRRICGAQSSTLQSSRVLGGLQGGRPLLLILLLHLQQHLPMEPDELSLRFGLRACHTWIGRGSWAGV